MELEGTYVCVVWVVCVTLFGEEKKVNYARLCVIAQVQFNLQVLCDVTACHYGYSCRRFGDTIIFQNAESCTPPQTA
jgi:hypothetical protein